MGRHHDALSTSQADEILRGKKADVIAALEQLRQDGKPYIKINGDFFQRIVCSGDSRPRKEGATGLASINPATNAIVLFKFNGCGFCRAFMDPANAPKPKDPHHYGLEEFCRRVEKAANEGKMEHVMVCVIDTHESGGNTAKANGEARTNVDCIQEIHKPDSFDYIRYVPRLRAYGPNVSSTFAGGVARDGQRRADQVIVPFSECPSDSGLSEEPVENLVHWAIDTFSTD